MYTQELHVTSNIAWCHLLPADDLAPGEKQLQDVRFKALSWSLLETAVRPQKKRGTWKTANLSVISVISVRVIISNYNKSFHTISYHNSIRIFSGLILRFHHIHCLQVFSHSQINLKTRQQGCRSHGRACHVHFCPSKAMAEAMDAAGMPGLHLKLFKLHRNLGDDFSIFSIFSICRPFEVTPHRLDWRCSAFIDEDDPNDRDLWVGLQDPFKYWVDSGW